MSIRFATMPIADFARPEGIGRRPTRILSLCVVCLLLATAWGREASSLTPQASTAPDDKAPVGGTAKVKGRVIKLDAKPDAITFDTAKAAVIVVDMQNDFGSKGGMFYRAGIDISGIQKAVGPTAKVLAVARKAGVKIIYLKMGYKPDLSDLGSPDSVNRVRPAYAGSRKMPRNIGGVSARSPRVAPTACAGRPALFQREAFRD